ncbi:MAG: recombination-associated protein RdgC [Azonexus sp.]|nr:recombination-associated protein RdgC [Azonexus sp.]MCK6413899.1 recombination-associated protein RdgC [Azonexus sp.]
MWFKNLQLYRLPAPWTIDLARFDEQLARGGFRRCASHEPISRGWVAPRTDGSLVHSLAQQWLLTLAVEQRLLPASVVNQETQERAEAFELEHGYFPGRKQLRELKERVTEELMPRAFTRRSKTQVWIDPQNGWFAVDAGSQGKAEEVIEHLRQCLDDFPLKPLHTQLSPISAMADWLAGGDAPAGFTVDRDCELKAVDEEKQTVRYVRHPLDGEEVRGHLAAGKLPTRLALTWDDRISFVLTDKLEVKRLAFLDVLKEEAEKGAEHADEQFDSDFALMTGELARFLPDLVAALGGEAVESDGGALVAAINAATLAATPVTAPATNPAATTSAGATAADRLLPPWEA